jgi:uncharacterized damage-inducible protein DinB
MNLDYLKTLYDYNFAANRRLWDCILQLSDEQFVHEVDYSFGSVRNQMVHLTSGDDRWLARLEGRPVPEPALFADYLTPTSAFARWEQVAEAFMNHISALTPEQLHETIEYNMPHRGGLKRNFRWHILAHVVNHATDHRAQVLRMLYDLGAPTFEQDLMIYLWQQGE